MDRFLDFIKFLDQLQGTHNAQSFEQDLQVVHQEDAGLQTVGIHIFDAFFAGL